MHNHWLRPQLPFLFAFLFLVWPGSAAAEIVTINPNQPPQSILTPTESEKLAVLQNTQDLILFSGVSPDDQVVVIGAAPLGSPHGGEPEPPQLAFLNIEDGSMQPIDPMFLMMAPQTLIGWRDAQTAIYPSSNSMGEPVLVLLHRMTGAVEASALSAPGMPVSLAPNGTRLLVEMAGEAGTTLAAVDLATGSVEALLDYPNGGGPSHIAWSTDGAKVALVRVMPSPELTADADQITELATQEALGQLPLAHNPFFQGNVVDLFDFVRHEFQPAAIRAANGDGYLFQQVSWSPDGQILLAKMVRPSQPQGRQQPTTFFPDRAYFRFYDASLTQIGILDRPEIEAALTTHTLFVSPDEVIFVAPAGVTFRLYLYARQSGRFRSLAVEEGTFAEAPHGYQIHATHRSRQLIFNHSSFQRPPEIYRLGLDEPAPQALTSFNTAAALVNQIRVDALTLRLKGRITRTGYLLQPANAPFPPQEVPIVLYQQGGPGGAMTNRWGATSEEPFNLLPNFGMAVLFMPFTGREGFGPDFFNALVGERKFGAVDIDEAAQAVQALVAQGYTSPRQVGITGCSYGGYFTSQSLVRHPELYAAANAQCSPLDLVAWWDSVGRLLITYVEGRLPSDSPFEYRRDSPLQRAARIRTPLLLFHAAEDFLPVDLAKDFHDRVAGTGTPVILLVFEQEGHSLALPSSRYIAAQCQIAWFRRYLGIASDETQVCISAKTDH